MKQRPGYLSGLSGIGYVKSSTFSGIQPRQLRGLGNFGKGRGPSNMSLPNSKYGFSVQFFPGIPELQQYGAAESQEAEAGKINAFIKQEIQTSISQAQANGFNDAASELQSILSELNSLSSLVGGMPFTQAPQVPAHRAAQKLAKDAMSKAMSGQQQSVSTASSEDRPRRRKRRSADSSGTSSNVVPITTTHASGINVSAPSTKTIPLPDAYFMRASGEVASRLTAIPEGWNEEAYLAKNPDVAKAVDQGIMPSGLWHYLKYGKNENRALAGWKRPGFLAGVFNMWVRR